MVQRRINYFSSSKSCLVWVQQLASQLSTTCKTATEKRALVCLPLTLQVSVCPRPSVPYCNSEDFPDCYSSLTDRHTATIMSLLRTQIKIVQALRCSFQRVFEHENLSKQKCYSVSIHDK